MTRNPLALAEVLYLLSRNWRGTGYIGKGLEMLCIINPSDSSLDESENWLADLLSTHPPIKKRIRLMLNMAHAGISSLKKRKKAVVTEKNLKTPDSLFYALDNHNQWQGPYTLAELAVLPWLSALSWVSKGGETAEKASLIPLVNTLLHERLAREESMLSAYMCPGCRSPLITRHYEKTTVYQCRFCGGSLVENRKLSRIIARKGIKYSDRVKALSRTVIKENQGKRIAGQRKISAKRKIPLLKCPKCARKMSRTFYSLVYLIELDRCSYCSITWFDYDELEMLQCMIDNKMASSMKVS
jgi:Zn-finger nucleic acid-binding protein